MLRTCCGKMTADLSFTRCLGLFLQFLKLLCIRPMCCLYLLLSTLQLIGWSSFFSRLFLLLLFFVRWLEHAWIDFQSPLCGFFQIVCFSAGRAATGVFKKYSIQFPDVTDSSLSVLVSIAQKVLDISCCKKCREQPAPNQGEKGGKVKTKHTHSTSQEELWVGFSSLFCVVYNTKSDDLSDISNFTFFTVCPGA